MKELILTIFTTLLKSRLFIIGTLLSICSFLFFSKVNFIINFSHSLPQKVFIVDVGNKNISRGDYLAFIANNQPWATSNLRVIKIVYGMPGDNITVKGNKVFINKIFITNIFYKKAAWGEIHPIANTLIPKGCYFLQGTSKTSFDSRYKEFGLICREKILGKAYPLF